MNNRPAPAFVAAEDPTDLTAEARRELVAEAFHTFGEAASRELAAHYHITFDSCADDIARLSHPGTCSSNRIAPANGTDTIETESPESQPPGTAHELALENDILRITDAVTTLCDAELRALDVMTKITGAHPHLARTPNTDLGKLIYNPIATISRHGREVLVKRLVDMVGAELGRAIELRAMAEASRQLGYPLTDEMKAAFAMIPKLAPGMQPKLSAGEPATAGFDGETMH